MANYSYDENSAGPQDPTTIMQKMMQKGEAVDINNPRSMVKSGLTGLATGVNKGMAGLSSEFNTMYNYIREKANLTDAQPDLFQKAAEEYTKNAAYWEDLTNKYGAPTAWKWFTNTIGEAPAGIASFAIGVGPAAVRGAAEAKEKGTSEAVGAAKGAAGRFMMGKVLKAAQPLHRGSRMLTGAGLFAGQTAAQDGSTGEDIAKAAITGAMFTAPGGKGKVGIQDMGREAVKLNQEMGQRGSIPLREGGTPLLVPAIRQGKIVVSGAVGDTHPDVLQKNKIEPDADHERGFTTAEGKFLSRAKAKQWMKKNRPDLYEQWVKTVEEEGKGSDKALHSQDLNVAQGLSPNKGQDGPTFGSGLGGAQDIILKGLDRWLSPTKEHLGKQKEAAMPPEEWKKRIEAWGSKNPHIKDENQWNGLQAWVDSKKGEKSLKKDDIMEFLELGKGKWAVREQTHGIDPKYLEELKNKPELTRGEQQTLRNMEEGRTTNPDPWADRNVPGGIPGTEKVWTLSLPTKPIDYENVVQGTLRVDKIGSKYAVVDEYGEEVSGDQYNTAKEAKEAMEEFKQDQVNAGIKYQSPHFPDKPNVVVHFRTQEIKDSTGNKGVLIETVQSDWHQSRDESAVVKKLLAMDKEYRSLPNGSVEKIRINNEIADLMADHPNITPDVLEGKIPTAPFEHSWAEVGLKHAIDIAVQDPSIKWIGWSGGKVQNERWGKGSGDREDYQDAMADLNRRSEQGKLTDLEYKREKDELDKQFNTSGEGFLTTLYDKRLPKFAKKYAEKIGGKYEDHVLDNTNQRVREDNYPIHRINITDQMRSHINTKGQEFYSGIDPAKLGSMIAPSKEGGKQPLLWNNLPQSPVPDKKDQEEPKRPHTNEDLVEVLPPTKYDGILKKAADENNLDYTLLKSVAKVESNFNPKAKSKAGAVGLMQLTPASVAHVRNNGRPINPWRLHDNVFGGANYLSYLIKHYKGDVPLALAAYNGGLRTLANVDRDISKMPKETQDYVKRVMKYYEGEK